MIFPKKYIWTAFFTIVLYAFIFNEWNRQIIIRDNPSNIELNDRSLVNNSTVFSVDNEWYLPQIKHFLNGKGFTSNPNMAHYDVRRTPVYPLFYGVHYLIFGEYYSYFVIRITQILLFALAAIALLFAVFNFTNNKAIAIISTALFAFHPTLVSYLYFTITEAVSASLVCFLLYFLSYCYINNTKKDWLLAGFFFALCSLCRPPVFFFAISVLFALIYINRKSLSGMVLNGLWVLFGAGILFVPHIIRNYMLTKGDIILLEKHYGDPMNFGIPNIELRNWIACWMNPADYSSETVSGQMMTAISTGKERKESVMETQIKRIPAKAFLINKKEDVVTAYSSLYDYYAALHRKADSLETRRMEKACIHNMQGLKNDFVQKAPVQYYLATPLFILKSIIFQSNASTIAILDHYQVSAVKKAIKVFLYLLNVFLFFSMAACLVYLRKYLCSYGVCILFISASIFYIAILLRYFEARYLVPLFPCMFILAAIFSVETVSVIRKAYTSR